MEKKSDVLEIEDPEFRERVRRYFEGQFGDTALLANLRAQITEQLGEQERGAVANANGTPSIAPHTSVPEVKEYPSSVELPKVKSQSQPRRFNWSLAVAATAILALGILIVGFLGIGRGFEVGNLLGHKEQVIFSDGFENGLDGWTFTDNRPTQYKEGIDNSTSHSGRASTYIESTVDTPDNSAWRGRNIDAKDYLDKRIRFSAYVKTSSDELVASLGMIVGGEQLPSKVGQPGPRVRMLGRDDMSNRYIRGKLDWQRYDIVLDVPADAKDIYIYLMTEGQGRVWFDDATLSVADGNVPVTNLLRFTEPGNTGFEDGLARWSIASTAPNWFALSTNSETKYKGNASAVISSTFGTKRENTSFYLSQVFATDNYKGKKVRFSAQIKRENVQDEAELWIGVRDLAGADMSPDTIGSDKGMGTTDWREYQAVINVPDDSLFFLMFVGLNGKGKMWIDNVRLDVVGDYVPPTNAAP